MGERGGRGRDDDSRECGGLRGRDDLVVDFLPFDFVLIHL